MCEGNHFQLEMIRYSMKLRYSRSNKHQCHRYISIKNSLSLSPYYIIKSNENSLSWYSCGPTVYDSSHIGHARTYICTDIIRRIVNDYFHISIHFALGITDIDDKIIMKAKELCVNQKNERNNLNISNAMNLISKQYEDDFFHDMDSLNVKRPHAILRVTEHIHEVIEYIKGIEKSGCTYELDNGLYFNIVAFEACKHSYGKLGMTQQVQNIEIDSTDDIMSCQDDLNDSKKQRKRSNCDFALWKRSKDDEPYWDSPWGKGRPGKPFVLLAL